MTTTTTPGPVNTRNSFKAKHALWIVFGLMTALVILTRDRTLLDPHSFLRQRYAPIPLLMFLHGIPGAIALFIAPFQFSSRLRQSHIGMHRFMGRLYIFCVAVAASISIPVAVILGPSVLVMAVTTQAIGWIVTTATPFIVFARAGSSTTASG